MSRTNFKELLEAGVHFGHLKKKYNPAMAPYIFMERNGITMVTSKVGKIKTAIQMMAINVILFYMIILSYNISEIIYLFDNFSIIYIFMFITTMITFITGLDYFVKNHGAIKVIFINRE